MKKWFLLIATLFIVNTAFAAPAKPSHICAKKGASSIKLAQKTKTVHGAIKSYKFDSYVFYAKKGQVLTTHNSNQNKLDVILFNQDTHLDNNTAYTITQSGCNELRVLQTRQAARQNGNKRIAYTLKIQLK